MTDNQIIALYFHRSERAITETAAQYGNLFFSIAHNILHNRQDSEECVNDTYLAAWNTIPPTRPKQLSVFLGKITRRLSIDKWRINSAAKRGGGQLTLAIEELDWALASPDNLEEQCIPSELTEHLNAFLKGLPEHEQQVFLCRYWYMDSIADIAHDFGFTQSKVRTMLMRTRNKLRAYLESKGGYSL